MFIIVEGIDGSGKSGLIDALTSYYKNYKRADIREQWSKVNKKDNASRKKFFVEYFEKNKNENIIIDRFHISEIIYDATLRQLSSDTKQFEKRIFGKNISNVILIVIDVHESVAQERIRKRDGKDEQQNLALERSLFMEVESQSTIVNKFFIYNDKLDVLIKKVKEYVENVCGVSGKILTK